MRRFAIVTTLVVFVLSFVTGTITSNAQDFIKPSDALQYVGKYQTVCGQVASTKYATRSRGRPTFLNLDQPYPNRIFSAVIWGQNRHKFQTAPERAYRGKRICVSGSISTYKGVAQIVVSEPSQIQGE